MKKTLIVVGVLIALVGAWLWGLPAYRARKERVFATQAKVHFVKGEYRGALLSAQQALVLNGSNVLASEVMAELSDMGRSPNAIIWRRRIADSVPTLSNQIVLVSCALRYEQPPFAFAQQALATAAKNPGAETNVAFHVVSAQLALKQGRITNAVTHFETANQLEPTNGLHRLNLATVRLESRDAEVSRAAHAELEAMQANAQLGEHASRALAMHHAARKELGKALEYSSTLVTKRNASFDDKLDHLSLLHEAKPPEFVSYASTLQKGATNAALVFALASRMLVSGEAAATLAWLKTLPADLQSEQPVPLAFADALARLKDWRGMEQRLNGERWKDQDFMRLALMSFAVRNQNDDSVARVHWNKAVELASDRPERLAMLVQMANGWRWNAEAEGVLWRVVKSFPKERWAIDALQNGYVQNTNTHGLLTLYSTMLEREPTNAAVMNNFASLALLLNTNLSQAHQLAEQVYHKGTNNFAFVSTYAWSLYLQGKKAEGLALMEKIEPVRLADPSVAAYYGAMLVGNGQKAKAREVLDKAQGATLLPEERALAEQARRNL